MRIFICKTDVVLARARGPNRPHGSAEAEARPHDMAGKCGRRVLGAYDKVPASSCSVKHPVGAKMAAKRPKMAPMTGAISKH